MFNSFSYKNKYMFYIIVIVILIILFILFLLFFLKPPTLPSKKTSNPNTSSSNGASTATNSSLAPISDLPKPTPPSGSTQVPTPAPTQAPTSGTITVPTPTQAPIRAPTQAPTPAPTTAPTNAHIPSFPASMQEAWKQEYLELKRRFDQLADKDEEENKYSGYDIELLMAVYEIDSKKAKKYRDSHIKTINMMFASGYKGPLPSLDAPPPPMNPLSVAAREFMNSPQLLARYEAKKQQKKQKEQEEIAYNNAKDEQKREDDVRNRAIAKAKAEGATEIQSISVGESAVHAYRLNRDAAARRNSPRGW
jgi:cytoskeletal protein RodZ